MIEKPKRPKQPNIQDRQPPRTLEELINRYDLDNTKVYDFLDGLVDLLNTREETVDTDISNLNSSVTNLSNNKVNKSGDTLTGGLLFENKDVYDTIRKTRTLNGTDYQITLGLGRNASARMEFVKVPDNVLSSVEARSDGIYNGVSGKKLAEQSTGWTNATLTSKLKSTGAIKYTKIGNVVIVNFVDIEVNSSIASHGDILATGLPNSTIYLISALFNHAKPSKPMRIAITTDGKIQTHYSNNFTASESTGFYGTIVYMTNQ